MKEQLPSNENISTAIRLRLAELDMTRNELCEKTGFSRYKVNKMCCGMYDFSLAEIVTLESALGEYLMLIPDMERTISISMHIDNHRHQATLETTIIEDGKQLHMDDLTTKKLLSTINALITASKQMQEFVLYKLINDEEK